MMKNLKRFAAAALTLCMLLTLLPGGAYAESSNPAQGWSLSDDGTLTVTRIPDSEDGWSEQAASITKVVIGAGVDEVDGGTFTNCLNLAAFEVEAGNSKYTAGDDGVLYTADRAQIVCYPPAREKNYAGKSGVYMVPESVTGIANGAFSALTASGRTLSIYALEATLTAVEASAIALYTGHFPSTDTVKTYTYVPATGIASLNYDALTLDVGGTATLTATVAPEADESGENGATFAGVTWSSQDASVAAVNATTGTVTGIKAGSTVIVATTADGGYTKNCAVEVRPKNVTGLTLSAESLALESGGTAALTATITPYDATYKTVTFLSTDPSVAKVLDNGAAADAVTVDAAASGESASAAVTVRAAGAGAAGIVAITQDGGLYAVCKVTVPEVTLNKTALTLGLGQTETLYATVNPGTLGDYTVNWESNDASVATVDDSGKITPHKVGAATITVSAAAGGVTRTAACAVTVQNAPVTRVTLDQSELALDLVTNTTATLRATVEPAGLNGGTVTWSSTNKSVATVSNGAVTAVAPGMTAVTASVTENGTTYTATCAVAVAATRVTAISLDWGNHELALGATETLTAKLTPGSPTEAGITWRSTAPEVVSVAQDANNGLKAELKALKVGTASIIATTKDGALTAVCAVTVPVTAITKFELNKTALELTRTANGGEVSGMLSATVEPSNATYGAVSWYSSDESVVTVSGNGNSATLTTAGPGKAAIVARTEDGRMDSCAVTVWDAPTGAGVSMTALTLAPTETATLYAVILPSTADQSVKWSSSDAGIAAVDENTGEVTAVAGGTAAITATSTASPGIKAACTVTVRTSVASVTLNKTSLTLAEGASETLTATVKPDGATQANVTWTSYNESVATVDGTGKVTAVAPGATKILAVTADGGKTAECAVTVNATKVTGVTLNKSAVTLGLNAAETLTATVTPGTAANKAVTWESSDTSVATVSDGVVTATAKEGTATITVATSDGGFTAECTVTVARAAVTRVTLDKDALTLDLTNNTSGTLTATLTPSNADNKAVTWTSSNESVATVSGGAVTAKAAGSAVITVTTADGAYTAKCAVTVEPTKATGVTLSEGALGLKKGDTAALTATVAPSEATDKTVKWLSTNESAVTVENGTITARDPGTAVIIATTADGGFTAKCAVTVYQPVTAVSIHKSAITLDAGGTDTLAAIITPDNASKDVKWSSSDTSVVTVGETSGAVTAVKGGTATITVTAADGKTASCNVTVRVAVTGVDLSETEKILELGGTDAAATATLTATVAPGDATDPKVLWYSSDKSVAEVDDHGKVTAKKAGTAAIIAVTADGGKTASCAVTVRNTVTGVTLDHTALSLMKGTSGGLMATVDPSGAEFPADQSVTWTSSNTSVATVTNGVVVAVAVGTARITATSVANTAKSASCEVTVTATVVPVEDISLSASALTLNENQNGTLTATVTPADASDKTVNWTSTDIEVATVASGVVTAVAPGKATIIAQTADGNRTALCKVTVLASVTGVSLSRGAMTLGLKQTDALTAAIAPYNAANQNITWSVSGDAVRVNGEGKTVTVEPVKTGKASVTVTTADGEKTASCEVEVLPTAVNRAEISPGTIELIVGEALQAPLTVTISPSDSSTPTVAWGSSDDTIATVSNGTVTAAKVGTALITATVTDQTGQIYTASCAVTVKPRSVTGVRLDKSTLSLALADSATLKATVDPGNATDQAVTWRSTNETVATVDGSGAVTAAGAGTATIIATTKDGSHTASCAVTVTSPKVTGLTLDKAALSLVYIEGNAGSETLTATVASGGNTGTVAWESSDLTVATVTDGTVTAAGKGTATITASVTEDGKTFSATCAVTVRSAVTGVTLRPESAVLELGGSTDTAASISLTAAVTPSYASDPSVIWYTSNPAVATVSGGTVTAVNPGTAVITVATADGGYAQSCAITVRKAITEVKLNKTALTLTAGDTEALIATVNEGADGGVTWSSSNTSVATVENGVVKAIAEGTATITVTSAVNTGITATCDVTVNARTTPVTGVTLNKTTLTLKAAENGSEAESETLTATVAPEDATDRTVSWRSTDTSVATVADGTVTAVAAGKAAIIVTTTDGRFTAMCTVTVPAAEVIAVTGVTIKLDDAAVSSLTLYVGDNSKTLSAAVAPGNATNKEVSWTSYDTAVVEVDQNGKLVPKMEGTTVVAAASGNGKLCTVAVTVKQGVSKIELPETFALAAGSSGSLTATVSPATMSNAALTWSSSDRSVAAVDEKGVVTAFKAGTTTITASHTDDGSTVSDTCTVTVTQPVTGVTVTPGTQTLSEGGTLQLAAAVSPTDATIQTVTWSSSDDSVATVDANGKVTGVKAGTATIYAVTDDRGFTGTCIVTVGETEVQTLTVTPGAVTLTVGDDKLLAATVTPSGATYGTVTWFSSDTDVATVNAGGVVHALKAGTAAIVAATADGKHTATSIVTVENAAVAATGVTLDKSELAMNAGESALLTATVTPDEATDKTVAWSSSNNNVVTVDANGIVTAVASGTAVITATAGGSASCTVTVKTAVSGVAFTTASATLLKDEDGANTVELTASFVGSPTDRTLTWNSSDGNVATVTVSASDGTKATVTAVGAGRAAITAVTQDGGYTATCIVTVPEIKLGKTEVTLTIGETEPLTAFLTPAGFAEVQWTTSDGNVAAVDGSGTVTAVAKGSATITATAGGVSATCAVTVQEKGTISLSETNLALTTGGSRTLAATVTPDGSAAVTWFSTNEDVATVDVNGAVTAKKAGSAAIIASANGYTAACAVTVTSAVTGVTLGANELTLYIGGVAGTLSATVEKSSSDAPDLGVTWMSTDPTVATASGGVVTAVSPGTAVIIATAVDGGQAAASCVVTVWEKTTSLTLSRESLVLAIGDSWSLTATLNEGANPAVVWSVEGNGTVVTVSGGVITAIGKGTATVKATGADGLETAVCSVTVREYVVSNAVETPEMSISEQDDAGKRTVTLAAAAGDEIYYYTTTDTTPIKYTSAITVGTDTTLKAYAVHGSFQSAVVTGVITVNEASNAMMLTDAMGNTVSTLDETSDSFGVNITLADGTTAAGLYLAVYDRGGALVSISKCETNGENDAETGTASTTLSIQFAIPDVEIGCIRLMLLDETMTPLTGAGGISGG